VRLLKSSRFAASIAFAVLALMAGCATVPVVDPYANTSVELGIPDRRWDPERPDKSVGWCGEACIQMAMGYYGKEISQQAINRAGRPDHPDLYAYDLDDAMDALGISYLEWKWGNRDLESFIVWIKKQLAAGFPVICGVKIYPDKQPNWYLDHFVLVVGFNEYGMIINTQPDLDGQMLIPYSQLVSSNPGYSFKSRKNRYFGWAVTGPRLQEPE
jgi:hypothetical protein